MVDTLDELGIRKASEDVGVRKAQYQPKKPESRGQKVMRAVTSVGKTMGAGAKRIGSAAGSYAKSYAESRESKLKKLAQRKPVRRASRRVHYVTRRPTQRVVYVERSAPARRKKRIAPKKREPSIFNMGYGSIIK